MAIDHSAGPHDALGTIAQAMQAHRDQRLADADALYRRALEQAPRHPDALHLLGLLKAQQGEFDAAAALIAEAIEVHPGEPMYHNNLGNVHIERGELEAAEADYRRALELEPDRIDAANNLGVLLSRSGRGEEGARLLERVVERAPAFIDAHQNLANHYLRHGEAMRAMEQCVRGMVVAPRSAEMRRLLGLVYINLGMNDKAAELYRAWLEAEPDSAEARHHLVACTGVDVPERASDRYVADTFDGFAASFDAKLAMLSYRAPELVAAAVARHAGTPAGDLAVLDAGCGTGWCGPLLKAHARHLVGVDLSAGMLHKAVLRRVYDDLEQAELVAYLRRCESAFDLVVSADTLCYFGRLDEFAAAARAALRPGGRLVFTVESHPDGDAVPAWRLHPHGRYSHCLAYLRSTLREAGLAVLELSAVVLRDQGHAPVEGWLACARAPGATTL